MIHTGLKYTQFRVDDGTFVFKLEPSGIEDLIAFGGESKVLRSRYGMRQLVCREMEREKIRRRKGGSYAIYSANSDLEAEKRGVKRTLEEQPKKAIVEKVKKDFFGRPIFVDNGKRRMVDSNDALRIRPKVWVRYHEGYSNAVRKPAAFSDLLGRQ
jgi:chromosome transmission fidelity protein 18